MQVQSIQQTHKSLRTSVHIYMYIFDTQTSLFNQPSQKLNTFKSIVITSSNNICQLIGTKLNVKNIT